MMEKNSNKQLQKINYYVQNTISKEKSKLVINEDIYEKADDIYFKNII